MTRRIGVEVTTDVRSAPTAPGGPAGTFHIAGVTERGPVGESVTVRSATEFERRFGGRTPYSGAAYDSARSFFSGGGTQMVFSRVVGPDAETASVDLEDSEEDGDSVVRVSAVEPGTFGNQLTVEVESNGSPSNRRYTIRVVDGDGEALATWRDVTTVSELVSRAATNSNVNVRSLAEGDDLTLAEGEFSLEGGDDDRENVSVSEVIEALETGGDVTEGSAVAIPGYPADVIGEQLINHASENRKIALLAGDADASRSELEDLAEQLQSDTAGEYAGIFYPHVMIPDSSGARMVSPEGTAAAARARTFATGEWWNMPAGTERGRASFVNSTVPPLSREDVERLDEAHVNGLETGRGRVYLNNWTSLAQDRENLRHLRDADFLNNLAVMIERALEQYVWETIDGRGALHSDIDSTITAIVSEIASAGGLFANVDDEGEEIDPGYLVAVNPDPGVAAQDRVEVSVSVRVSSTAKLISVGLIKVAIGGNL